MEWMGEGELMERKWILKGWWCGEKYNSFLQCLELFPQGPLNSLVG